MYREFREKKKKEIESLYSAWICLTIIVSVIIVTTLFILPRTLGFK